MLKCAVHLFAEKYNLKIWDSGASIPGDFIKLILKDTTCYSDAYLKMKEFLEPKFLKFTAGSVLYITLAGGIDLHQGTVQKLPVAWGIEGSL